MKYFNVNINSSVGIITFSNGKVNALNEEVIDELMDILSSFEKNQQIKSLILTGTGKFFSFGFDIPLFMSYSKENFTKYLKKFTALYKYLFTFPKFTLAGLNGHTIAGGCMIALACDKRIMINGNVKISLNEITFGSSVFAGSIEMLRFIVGSKNATEILYTGKMYDVYDALKIGLINKILDENKFKENVFLIAKDYANKSIQAFSNIKLLLRKPIAEEMEKHENRSIAEFVDIWYYRQTQKYLKEIKIY